MISSVSFKSSQEDYNSLPRERVSGGATGIAATLAGIAAAAASEPITIVGILPAMKKAGEFDAPTIKNIHDGAKKALKETGLEAKGVEITFIPQSKNKKLSLKDFNNPITMVRKGINAFFVPRDVKASGKTVLKKNSILMPERDISFALYHELGHAHNFNLSKCGKILQQCRPISMFGPILLMLYGAFSRKSKTAEGKNLTFGQKLNNFLRVNAGKLSLALTAPMLIEEGMATKKGLEWAKKYLSPENFKNVKKGSFIAYSSYLLTAISFGLAARVAVKVKDKLIAKKERKQEEIYKQALAA